MTGYVLHLEGATQYERIEGVVSFVGEDASGGFGILPGHARTSTVLEIGLARFRVGQGDWQFIAAPGAVVRFVADELHFSARRYLRDTDLERVRAALQQELIAEETALRSVKQSLQRLEKEMLRRLWRLGRGEEALS